MKNKDKNTQENTEKENNGQTQENENAEYAESAENSENTENAESDYEMPKEEEPKQSKEEEYLLLAQRIQADFDNYRKRNVSMRADALEEGKADAVKAFLPVMDNLERALQTEKNNGTGGSLMEGLEMVLKQMAQVLKDLGVEEIDAEGKEFDPACHNAVMQVPAEENQKPGFVAAVFEKGYKIGDKVIRYSMVQVTI